MFPDFHDSLRLRDRSLHTDRRPLPRASEIQLRVRRLTRGAS
jgi:hypothetical protein